VVEVPRVARWGERQVEARPTNRKFVRCKFAEQDCTSALQFRFDDAVLGRHVVKQQFRVARGGNAGRGVDVLEGVGNAVHRSPINASFELTVGAIGIRQSPLLGDEDESVQARIECGNSRQTMLRQCHWRERTSAQSAAGFGDR
jgi:hypothetical protein